MTIYHSELQELFPDPYTEVTTPTNLKWREVRCDMCKYTIRTNLPNPKCGKCRNTLTTIIQPVD